MSAAKHSIIIEQGSLFEIELAITDETNQKINLTGFNFVGKVRKSTDDPSPLATFSFEIKDQNAPETLGVVRAYLPTAQTAGIVLPGLGEGRRLVAEYIYDIKYGPSGGEMKRLLEGAALVSAEASQ